MKKDEFTIEHMGGLKIQPGEILHVTGAEAITKKHKIVVVGNVSPTTLLARTATIGDRLRAWTRGKWFRITRIYQRFLNWFDGMED